MKEEQSTLEKDLHPSPQESRVGRNLAAVVLAGELAIEYGIFPFKTGTIRTAVRTIFESWLPLSAKKETSKNREHNKIITAIRDFIDIYSQSRFTSALGGTINLGQSSSGPRVNELAGYWEEKDGRRMYLFNSAGRVRLLGQGWQIKADCQSY